MFSCAHWQTFYMYGYAQDEYGDLIRLNMDCWEMAWRFYYIGTLEGSDNESYPIIGQLH